MNGRGLVVVETAALDPSQHPNAWNGLGFGVPGLASSMGVGGGSRERRKKKKKSRVEHI